MLITYLAIKCLRYNTVITGKVDNQPHEVAACLIDQLQAYIHGQIESEKGQTSEPLASFLSGRKVKYPTPIRKA